MKKKGTGLMFGVLLATLPRVALAGEGLRYWSRYLFNLYGGGQFSVGLYAEARLYGHWEQPVFYSVSSKLKYKLHSHLDLQTNYTYIAARNGDGGYLTHCRIEPEINPHFTIGRGLAAYLRNRVEFRHIENKSWNNTRYRGRFRLTVPLEHSWIFQSVFTDMEFFYDFATREHGEQRTTPLGVNISIAKNIAGQLFYMVQRRKGAGDWFSNQVIGSMATVNF